MKTDSSDFFVSDEEVEDEFAIINSKPETIIH